MAEQSDRKLMDTTPGGESRNQYEDANIFVSPNRDQKANFGDDKPKKGDALEQDIKEKKEKAAHYAENREYGESISEHGFGGQTTSTEQPQPQHRHYGRDLKDEEEEELAERKKQGYGKGSGVGG